jgi:RimJ/RimL family protein N-acetyltransferase
MPHPYSLSDAHSFIDGQQDHPPINLAIEHKGHLAGVIGVTSGRDVERLSAEVGYWVGARSQGNGVATSALRAFIGYVFGSFPFTRLQCYVFEGNAASMRVLEKCGFLEEGVLRKAAIKDGSGWTSTSTGC